MRELRELHSPYPGLRPFGSDELSIFFGREAHTSRLIETLHRERFLAVVGPSGAGKSSLVRAGLLPGLAMGWPGDVSDWRIAELRPGERPMRRLAEALLQPDVLGRELGAVGYEAPAGDTAPDSAHGLTHQAALLEAELRAGPETLTGIVADALRQRPGQPRFNLLVLVDQFEELFRYAELGDPQGQESDGFVELLLASAQARESDARRIHVVLTMRTDALHDCVRFLDLPEAINRGQYLVPRLRPDELRRAITEPAQVFDGSVSRDVVDTLLTQVQTSPDQLPLLQHALAQMWGTASERDASHPNVTADDARDAGGLSKALSKHAEAIYAGLPTDDDRALADVLFRAITGPGEGGRFDSRRPQRLDQITHFAGLSPDAWSRFGPVLHAFAAEGANFLHFAEPLAADTVVDISHEALIRGWDRLRALVEWEAAIAAQYRRWRDRSEHRARQGGELLAGADLGAALRWQTGDADLEPGAGRLADGGTVVRPFVPHAGWAERYALAKALGPAHDEFGALLDFIEASQREADDREKEAAWLEAERNSARQREGAARLDAERGRAEAERLRAAAEAEKAEAAEREKALAEQGEQRTRRWLVVALVVALAALAMAGLAWSYRERSERKTVEAERNAETAAAKASEAEANARKAQAAEDAASAARAVAEQRASEAATSESAAKASASRARESETHASDAAQKTREALLASTALRLAAEGQAMVTGARVGGTEFGLLKVLAAHRIAPGVEPYSALYDALKRLQRLFKVASKTSQMNALAVSPDGHRIVSGGNDNSLQYWDSVSVTPVGGPIYGHSLPITSLTFSADGTYLYSVGGGTIRRWDAKTGARSGGDLFTRTLRKVNCIAVSPDSTRIVAAGVDSIQIWDARSGETVNQVFLRQDAGESINSLAFDRDGKRFIAANESGTLRWWDAEKGIPIGKPLVGHSGPVRSVAITPDGQFIVSGGSDKALRRWHVATGSQFGQPILGHAGTITSIALSSDSESIASGSEDGTLRLWKLKSGETISEPIIAHSGYVLTVGFYPDGRRIVSIGNDNTLAVWHTAPGAPIDAPVRLDGTAAPPNRHLSPERKTIVNTSNHDVVILENKLNQPWGDPSLGDKLVGHTGSVNSVAFSTSGKIIASGSDDRTIRLWNVQSRAPKGQPLLGHKDSVTGVAFNSSDEFVVSSSEDGTLRLWDTKTGAPLGQPLNGVPPSIHFGEHRIGFAERDRSVFLGLTYDSEWVFKWPVLDAWSIELCAKLTRNMTPDEWQRSVGDIPYRRQCPDLPGQPDDPTPISRAFLRQLGR